MKKLVILLPKFKFADRVLVNGENVSFKRNKKAKKIYAEYETTDEKVSISIDPYNPLNSWSWWLLGTLFFLISCFGIFDVHESHKFVYQYQSIVTLSEGENIVKITPLRGKGPVLKMETACPVDELINNKDRPKKIKRRHALLVLTKVLLVLSIVAVIDVFAIMLILSVLN